MPADGKPISALVVDDEMAITRLVCAGLELAGIDAVACTTGSDALRLMEHHDFDVIITDLAMPGIDGFEVLRAARERPNPSEVVVLTGLTELGVAVECMKSGAFDFITKPFELEVVATVTQHAAEKRRTELEMRELREVTRRSKYALMVALEARDCYTFSHCVSVARRAHEFAKYLGCSQEILNAIVNVGELHDVGKIGIPDHILNKPGKLTFLEMEQMKFHPAIGKAILDPIGTYPMEGAFVYHHHERWDGAGYPDRLQGEEIPLIARMGSPVDAFDALTTDRPYRRAMSVAEAVEVMRSERGKAFQPDVLDYFLHFLFDHYPQGWAHDRSEAPWLRADQLQMFADTTTPSG